MARKRRTKKYLAWLEMIIALVVLVGIGGLFIKGTFTSVVLLSFLPLIVHQVVGWAIVAGGIWKTIKNFM